MHEMFFLITPAISVSTTLLSFHSIITFIASELRSCRHWFVSLNSLSYFRSTQCNAKQDKKITCVHANEQVNRPFCCFVIHLFHEAVVSFSTFLLFFAL
jgi:hypothetical protein